MTAFNDNPAELVATYQRQLVSVYGRCAAGFGWGFAALYLVRAIAAGSLAAWVMVAACAVLGGFANVAGRRLSAGDVAGASRVLRWSAGAALTVGVVAAGGAEVICFLIAWVLLIQLAIAMSPHGRELRSLLGWSAVLLLAVAARMDQLVPQVVVDWSAPVGLLAAVLAVAAGGVGAVTTMRRLRGASKALDTERRRLEDRVADRTSALAEMTEEAQRARKAAEDASSAKSAFLADMSHELRTPLNAVLGYSEMLAEEAPQNSDLANDLWRIHRSGRHLLSLINDILDLSKVEAGKMDVVRERFRVSDVLMSVQATIEPLAAQSDDRFQLEVEGTLGDADTDRRKVEQILLNLLSNAVKFTESGRVTLRAVREVDWLVFEVEDQGIGMPAEQLEHIFEPFAQVRGQKQTKRVGTGLGLALTRRFCELLGGEVSVRSVVGQGSVFTVRIPVQSPTDSGIFPALLRPVRGQSEQPLVLVLGSDPEVRSRVCAVLRALSCRIESSESASAGLRLAERQAPSAFVVDSSVKDMCLNDLLSSIRRDPRIAEVPIVATVEGQSSRHLGQGGTIDYLAKPIDSVHLSTLVAKRVDGRRAGPVLVVDDMPIVRRRMREALERQGYEVEEAANGAQALEAARSRTPALVVLDLLMPESDGFEFLEAIEDDPHLSTVPVVVATAKTLSAAERRLLSARAVQTFLKADYTSAELTRTIARRVRRTVRPPESEDSVQVTRLAG